MQKILFAHVSSKAGVAESFPVKNALKELPQTYDLLGIRRKVQPKHLIVAKAGK